MSVVLEEVVARALRIPLDRVDDTVGYQRMPQWDSANHVALIGALEEAYGFIVDDDEIPSLTTLQAIRNYVEQHTAS